MEIVETRKLQLIGGSSFMVTLPKEWVLLNKLKQGDEIILQVQDKNIIVYPKKKGKEIISTTVKLPKADKEFIEKFLYSLYMLGLDEIILEFDDLPGDLIDEISDIVHTLIGMEIIDLSDNKIVIQCLTAHDLDITNVLKRKSQIASRAFDKIESFLRSGDAKEIKDISKLERDADRLYFLAVRLENRMMREVLPSNWDALRFILGSRMVAKFIEEIVDLLNDLSKLLEYVEKREDIADKFSQLHFLFKQSFDAYLRCSGDFDMDDVENAMKAIDNYYYSIKELTSSSNDPYLKLIFQMLLVISREIKAISEIAFNRAVREISRKNLRLLSKHVF